MRIFNKLSFNKVENVEVVASHSAGKEDYSHSNTNALDIRPRLNYFLFILPLIYGTLSGIYYYQSKSVFATYPDPAYIYLINGTNIACGNFDIGHVDNPGTPAQWLVGAIIFITNLFIGKTPAYESVFSNPELYLSICSFVAIALLLISVYLSGMIVLKNTDSLYLALFFQLIPISSYFVIQIFVLIIPEYIFMISIPYYCAFIFVLCYKRENFPYSSLSQRNHILFFAFSSALLITAKITCLPFLVIPLFLIRNFFQKVLYLFTTIFFAAIILYPAWPKLHLMFNWFLSLATHAGQYGGGNTEIINISKLVENIKLLFSFELFFTVGYSIVTILIIIGFLRGKRMNNFFRLSLALWITMTVIVIFAAKHFGYHYIIPAQLLVIPASMASLISLEIGIKKQIWNYFMLFGCSVLLILKSSQCATVHSDGNKIYESIAIANKYSNLPKIIVSGYQPSCFVESALHFGSCYGGDSFSASNFFLRKLYPNAYFYMVLDNNIRWWDKEISPNSIFEKEHEVLVYFPDLDDSTEKDIIERIAAGIHQANKTISMVDCNSSTGEKFYVISIGSSSIEYRYSERIRIKCDFEKAVVDKSAFVSADGNFKFFGTEFISTEKFFSKGTSVKCIGNQYPCCSVFDVKPGCSFDISVMVNYSSLRPGGIALAATDQSIFKKSSESIVENYGNGWKKVNLKTTIPDNYPEKSIRMCLYYFGDKTCYFDDLDILISKK